MERNQVDHSAFDSTMFFLTFLLAVGTIATPTPTQPAVLAKRDGDDLVGDLVAKAIGALPASEVSLLSYLEAEPTNLASIFPAIATAIQETLPTDTPDSIEGTLNVLRWT